MKVEKQSSLGTNMLTFVYFYSHTHMRARYYTFHGPQHDVE